MSYKYNLIWIKRYIFFASIYIFAGEDQSRSKYHMLLLSLSNYVILLCAVGYMVQVYFCCEGLIYFLFFTVAAVKPYTTSPIHIWTRTTFFPLILVLLLYWVLNEPTSELILPALFCFTSRISIIFPERQWQPGTPKSWYFLRRVSDDVVCFGSIAAPNLLHTFFLAI